MAPSRNKPGKDFEIAVYEFFRSRDRRAVVYFDHRVKDVHTGDMRQADVWIETHALGTAPYNILVSCKDHARRLDVGAIEQFGGEIESFGAHKGVLYSRAGFSKAALDKARAKNIDCCCLYRDKAPELPSEIYVDAYVGYPAFTLAVKTSVNDAPEELCWRDILSQKQIVQGANCTIRDLISAMSAMAALKSGRANAGSDDPTGTENKLATCSVASKRGCPPFDLHLVVVWHWHRGRLNAYRLNGSVTKTDGSFEGEVTVSAVPLLASADLGVWEPCDQPEKAHRLSVCFSLLGRLTPDYIDTVLRNHPVFGGRVWAFGPPPPEFIAAQLLTHLRRGNQDVMSVQLRVPVGRGS